MNEPKSIRAGFSAEWTETSGEYPATTHTLNYVLINSTAKIEIEGTADGASHVINLTATVTADYTPGIYNYTGYFENNSDASEKIIHSQGIIEVKVNVITASTSEGRSNARQVLDTINATILRMAGREQVSMSIDGRTISYNRIELLTMKARYEALVKQEEAEERINNGLPGGRQILVRF